MPTNITQIFDDDHDRFILRVSGEMNGDDAILIERLCRDLYLAHDKPISIDLADLDLLDSEAASILRSLAAKPKHELLGLEIFLQKTVNEVER